MLVIGLTGSIGMGKSTIAGCFRRRDIAVCDADEVVHGLYRGKAVPLIEAAFPGSTSNGSVDRRYLAEALLGNPGALQRLESLIHPLVQAEERAFLAAEHARGAWAAVLEIPLLFETGAESRVDATVVVSAPAEVQRRRVLARPGMSAEKFEALLARQLPDAEKRRRADFIVDTGPEIAQSCTQIDSVLLKIRDLTDRAYGQYWA